MSAPKKAVKLCGDFLRFIIHFDFVTCGITDRCPPSFLHLMLTSRFAYTVLRAAARCPSGNVCRVCPNHLTAEMMAEYYHFENMWKLLEQKLNRLMTLCIHGMGPVLCINWGLVPSQHMPFRFIIKKII